MTSRAGVGVLVSSLLLLALTACTPAANTMTDSPHEGDCRALTATDLALPSNDSPTVDCSEPHTAETYATGRLPTDFNDSPADAAGIGTWAYRTCQDAASDHLGSDLSTQMRSMLTWVWFRPSAEEWADGARWYRCDIVGGAVNGKAVQTLPSITKSLLATPEDRYMVCASGDDFGASERVSCDRPHDWRAVTTIKIGEPGDPYPGDDQVRAKSKAYCSDSVSAWLGYPEVFDYAYTWYDEAEWDAGNRRSVCWARTDT